MQRRPALDSMAIALRNNCFTTARETSGLSIHSKVLATASSSDNNAYAWRHTCVKVCRTPEEEARRNKVAHLHKWQINIAVELILTKKNKGNSCMKCRVKKKNTSLPELLDSTWWAANGRGWIYEWTREALSTNQAAHKHTQTHTLV